MLNKTLLVILFSSFSFLVGGCSAFSTKVEKPWYQDLKGTQLVRTNVALVILSNNSQGLPLEDKKFHCENLKKINEGSPLHSTIKEVHEALRLKDKDIKDFLKDCKSLGTAVSGDLSFDLFSLVID